MDLPPALSLAASLGLPAQSLADRLRSLAAPDLRFLWLVLGFTAALAAWGAWVGWRR